MPNEPLDPSDEKQVKNAIRKDRLFQRDKDEFLRLSLATVAGRQWFWDLLAHCGVNRNPFTGNNDRTNFNCGEQNIGLFVLSEIVRVNPDAYVRMMEDHNDRGNTSSTVRNDTSGTADGTDDIGDTSS